MAVECSSSLKRRAALGAAAMAAALLGGCVVAPMEPYEIGVPVVYSSTVYTPYYGGAYYGAPLYYYGPPAYYRPYWGPSVSLGIWGGWGGGRHWHGRPPGGGGAIGPGGFRGGREGVNRRP